MIAGTAALVLVAAAQAGAPAPDAGAQVVDAMLACRSITADAERLACFDRAAGAVQTARENKEIVIVDRAQIRRTKRGLFGFTLPRFNLFGGDDEADAEPEIKELDAKVTGASQYGSGLWQVTLDDGSVWRFTDPVFTAPKAGDDFHIKRAALGSYMGNVKGKRGGRIKRER